MRLALAALTAALLAPAGSAQAVSVFVVNGTGTVDPAIELRNPHVSSLSMTVTGGSFTCTIDTTERLSSYVSGSGPAWIDCDGILDHVDASCASARTGFTIEIACATFDDGGAVLQLVPHGDPLSFTSYDVAGVVAFAE